ncbi:hypothetical protein SAMN05216215_100317 [Saccharopolyspora shandongensis]|uniref:Uncharacterized protein n=1 Tax=Saccharopolyspora shandongensis TaxID=418495 RepID=A0A1H2T7V9_9PSEU|nr:hypothetical protein SAMN05216215_100317 [Saccharopolyspora shandongensis]
MPALPIPDAPPPNTVEANGLSHSNAAAREPRRERSGPSASATVRLCLVDPAAGADEIVTAAVSVITRTYTVPGDRIMLATSAVPTSTSRQCRDRLAESILRLGRGATTTADHSPRRSPGSGTSGGCSSGTSRSGSGLGPRHDRLIEPVSNPTDRPSLNGPSGSNSDGFALIIAGWSDCPVEPWALADSALDLAAGGAVVVLTRSSDQRSGRSLRSRHLTHLAAQAGLILTDRLILAHQLPSAARPPTGQDRRAIARGGHRRIHTAAQVFRHSNPQSEVRDA